MLDTPLLLIFPAAMVFAGVMDMLTMTIRNRISLGLAGAFAVAGVWAGLPTEMWLSHLACGGLMLAAGIGMFAMGWLGGGDAKLLAAGALWLGFGSLIDFIVLTGLFGSLLVLLILAYRRYPAGALPVPQWAHRLHSTTVGVPYGLAIAASALIVYPHSSIFRALVVGV
jgi:prepilin peptidase CpaA